MASALSKRRFLGFSLLVSTWKSSAAPCVSITSRSSLNMIGCLSTIVEYANLSTSEYRRSVLGLNLSISFLSKSSLSASFYPLSARISCFSNSLLCMFSRYLNRPLSNDSNSLKGIPKTPLSVCYIIRIMIELIIRISGINCDSE